MTDHTLHGAFYNQTQGEEVGGANVLFRLCCLPSHPSGFTLVEDVVRVCEKMLRQRSRVGGQTVTSCGVVGCDGLSLKGTSGWKGC